jgi:uncharacterized membrane protein (UPF0182 family)
MAYNTNDEISEFILKTINNARANRANSKKRKPSSTPTFKAYKTIKRIITGLIIAAVVLAILLYAVSAFATEILWYTQIGFLQVFATEIGMQIGVGAIACIVMFLVVFISIKIAYKSRPVYGNIRQAQLSEVSAFFTKHNTLPAVISGLIAGLFASISAAANWTTLLLMFNSVPFNKTDPQFHQDISFYIFILPGIAYILNFILACFIVGGLFMVVAHFVYGTIQANEKGVKLLTPARVQLAVYTAIICVILAANTFIGVFSTLTDSSDKITGATYTDVYANIPAKMILTAIMLIIALLFVVVAVRGHWKLSFVGIGVFVVSFVALQMVYPAVVQRFWVNPNAQSAEAPYIQRNIDATKDAYGLNNVKVTEYNAKANADATALQHDAEVTAQIRLLDPQVVSPTFRQLQQNKQYYNFADSLSVDKYTLGNEARDTIISTRELNLAGAGNDQRNWVNDHTVYTHGFGVVAAYGNKVNKDGSPDFFERNIPNSGELTSKENYEPRIYFSPNAPDYSIVGSDKLSDKWEFDYPSDGKSGDTSTKYTGNGGPEISNPLVKAMYAVKFGSDQIFFSNRVTSGSQILYDRDPAERVKKVAPYLTLDGRVYPAVVDGRVKYVVDGYTTSSAYPYSESVDLNSATKDSMTETSTSVKALSDGNENYIRNSVKATVDAYDGKVTLYAWDPNEPILQAWSKIFPNTYKPVSDISGDLMSHIRYPENLFKVQRSLIARYHVDSASQFFSGEDFWQLPDDPTADSGSTADVKQPPYYLTMKMPGQENPVFSLSSTFIPAGNNTREILTGFVTADSDAGFEKGKVGANYGTIRLLKLPKNSTVPGPGQVQNNFNANADVSKELNLLRSGSSKVVNGNLLTLPIGGGLVYVQPVYVQSSGTTSYPLLKKVLVAFGDKVGFSDTLEGALSQVFGTSGNANSSSTSDNATDATQGSGSNDASGDNANSGTSADNSGNASSGSSAELKQALSDAKKAMDDSQTAMKNNDWNAYGEAQKRLQSALDKANQLEK